MKTNERRSILFVLLVLSLISVGIGVISLLWNLFKQWAEKREKSLKWLTWEGIVIGVILILVAIPFLQANSNIRIININYIESLFK
jgi:uncharacterized membrane protein (DUF441 family)